MKNEPIVGAQQAAPLLERTEIYRGKLIHLTVDRVELPNGHVADLEIVRHPGAAAVVPIDDEGRVLFVRQYRHATGGFLLEVPAGKLDSGESPESCARREVEEETGYRPGHLIPMGCIWTTPGFSDERIWLFLATELQAARQALEADEVLTLERVPLEQALVMASRGDIADAKSVCALLRTPHFRPVG